MAPPPPTNLPLAERVKRLATTLQFVSRASNATDVLLTCFQGWFIGHATLLFAVFRYGLSYFTMNYYSRWAQFSYRLAFLSAVATYGIVVSKEYRARMKPGTKPQQMALTLLADENVQYLCKLRVWT